MSALRKQVTRVLVGFAIVFTALISVGLTAAEDGLFTISIRTVFVGIDVDVKIGSKHLHAGWSAIPPLQPSTKPASGPL